MSPISEMKSTLSKVKMPPIETIASGRKNRKLRVTRKIGINWILQRLSLKQRAIRGFLDTSEALVRHGRFNEADDVLSRGLAIFPGNPALLTGFAYSAHNDGRYDLAIQRWKAAMEAAPGDPMCLAGLAANLRETLQFDSASRIIADALRMFPSDVAVLTEAARCATARETFDEALLLWNEALARAPNHPDWLFGRANMLLRLKRFDEAASAIKTARLAFPNHAPLAWLEERSADELNQRRAAAADREKWNATQEGFTPSIEVKQESLHDPAYIFSCFESLGDNCEFGLVQRYCGIEPLGLFRFSSSQGPNLADAISTRFEQYGSDEDLLLLINEEDQEYIAKSKKYDDFVYHTETFSYSPNKEVLRARELKKIAYLKTRLIGDLASGEKIYVRKGGSFESMQNIFDAIQKIGPATLLCVCEAKDEQQIGHVEIVQDGLLKAYISRFAPYANAHRVDIACWLEICKTTLNLTCKTRGGSAEFSVSRNKLLISGDRWQVDHPCRVELTEKMSMWPGGDAPQRLILGASPQNTIVLARKLIDINVKPRSLLVFSAWVLIPKNFSGSVVDTFFINLPKHFVWQADLAKRDIWQQIWTSTRVPRDTADLWLGLRASGTDGDTIILGAWRLEEGCVPNNDTF